METLLTEQSLFLIHLVKGVSFRKDKQKWCVQIKADGKHIYLGTYTNLEEAAEVYNEAALAYHGSFARLNKLQSDC